MTEGKPKISICRDDVPFPGVVGKRGSGIVPGTYSTKAKVIERAAAEFSDGQFGDPNARGALRRAADAHLEAYLGRKPEANEVEQATKRIMNAIRTKFRAEDALSS